MCRTEVAPTLYVAQEHVMIVGLMEIHFLFQLHSIHACWEKPPSPHPHPPPPLPCHPPLFLNLSLCQSPPCNCIFVFLTRWMWSAYPLSSRPITSHHVGDPFCHKWPSAFNKTREASEAGVVKRSLALRSQSQSAVVMESGVRKLYFPRGHSGILWVICST